MDKNYAIANLERNLLLCQFLLADLHSLWNDIAFSSSQESRKISQLKSLANTIENYGEECLTICRSYRKNFVARKRQSDQANDDDMPQKSVRLE